MLRSGGSLRKWASIARAPSSNSSKAFIPAASATGRPTADQTE